MTRRLGVLLAFWKPRPGLLGRWPFRSGRFFRVRTVRRRSGIFLATAMLMAGAAESQAQTASGRGPLSWLGDLTGSINQPSSAPRQTTPAPAPAQRRMAQNAPKEWSGEDGASGHPLMTADAIRRSAANFDRCVAGMWPDAARRGVSQASFERFTQDLSPDLRIMDLMDSQPEFTKAVWDYLDILVTDARIARGREILAKNAADLRRRGKRPTVSIAPSSPRSGASSRTTARRRRPQRLEFHRDAGLHRTASGLLQG